MGMSSCLISSYVRGEMSGNVKIGFEFIAAVIKVGGEPSPLGSPEATVASFKTL